MKKLSLLFFLLTALPAFCDSISYLPLNPAGGSYSVVWTGVPPNPNIGMTELTAVEPGVFFLNIAANDNHGLLSDFYSGSVTDYADLFNKLGSVLELSNISVNSQTGQITAIFVSYGILQPNLGPGRITGIFHEQLNLSNGTLGGGYLTNMVSTAPEPETWVMMGTGVMMGLSFSFYSTKHRTK